MVNDINGDPTMQRKIKTTGKGNYISEYKGTLYNRFAFHFLKNIWNI